MKVISLFFVLMAAAQVTLGLYSDGIDRIGYLVFAGVYLLVFLLLINDKKQ